MRVWVFGLADRNLGGLVYGRKSIGHQRKRRESVAGRDAQTSLNA